jgi:hypothetical protein
VGTVWLWCALEDCKIKQKLALLSICSFRFAGLKNLKGCAPAPPPPPKLLCQCMPH